MIGRVVYRVAVALVAAGIVGNLVQAIIGRIA